VLITGSTCASDEVKASDALCVSARAPGRLRS
jgi:hypothetical protein